MVDKHVSYKVWKLPHPLILHWVLNPGLCINELLLGQRLPKISLVDQNSEKPLTERTHVECPHCETIHNSKLWGGGNTFWHYAGLYCPVCEEKIPTLLNVFSIIILVLTFPLWKPIELIYGNKFKAWELSRLRNSVAVREKPSSISGLKMGLFFGSAMGVFFLVQNTILQGWSIDVLRNSLIAAIFAGIFFGAIMKFTLSRKGTGKKPSA